MGLSKNGFGIHGTNRPSSIGKSASHGCIRMAAHDLEELFAMVEIGDKVELLNEIPDDLKAFFEGVPQSTTQVAVAASAVPAGGF